MFFILFIFHSTFLFIQHLMPFLIYFNPFLIHNSIFLVILFLARVGIWVSLLLLEKALIFSCDLVWSVRVFSPTKQAALPRLVTLEQCLWDNQSTHRSCWVMNDFDGHWFLFNYLKYISNFEIWNFIKLMTQNHNYETRITIFRKAF